MQMRRKKPVLTLTQRYGAWRSQEMELFEDKVRLVYRSGANRSTRTVPLEWIDRNESVVRLYPAWARGGVVCALLCAAAAGAAGLQWSTPWLEAAAGLAALALVLAVLQKVRSYEATYFYNSFTGEFQFALVNTNPDRETVFKFLDTLKSQSKKKRERAEMESEMPSVASEIHHLARLRETDVISEDEFTRKKEDLIEGLLRE